MGRRLVRGLGNILMVIGAAMLLVSAGYLVYGRIAEANFAAMRQSADFPVPAVTGPVEQPFPDAALKDGWSDRLQDRAPAAAANFIAVPFVSRSGFPAAQRVIIPRLGVDSPVTELGTKLVDGELVWDTPKFSVGHHQGTAQPGEPGNAVFSGHISSPLSNEGNVFSRLPEVRLGDEITVVTPETVITYVVTETKVVDPTHVEVMDPTPEPRATFITCYPDWVYTHRFIVVAKPVRWEFVTTAEKNAS
jgi:LPXTG-site transpeptidase (sortase) family protein